ncbi:MAG: hypothetical protein JWM48_1613 [Mycobacterium sp.]|nr:hypothetical protein [Mycobacterium sp.]
MRIRPARPSRPLSVRRLRRRHTRSERGAIAIFMTVVLVAVGLPVTAYAVNAAVSSGVSAELQHAADAGALAGAANIPLLDASKIQSVLSGVPVVGSITASLLPANQCNDGTHTGTSYPAGDTGTCATNIACQTAREALHQGTFAHQWSNGGADPAVAVSCNAAYVDPGLLNDLISCVVSGGGLVPTALPGIGSIVSGLASQALTPLLGLLAGVTPALMTPGVQVTLSLNTHGVFQGFVGGSGTTQAVAKARRHFKQLLVLPTVGPTSPQDILVDALGVLGALVYALGSALGLGGVLAILGIGKTISSTDNVVQKANGNVTNIANINPALQTLTSTVLTGVLQPVTNILGTLLPACQPLLRDVNTELTDLTTGNSNPPTVSQLINDATANGSNVMVASLVTGTAIPFLQFVPVCLANSGTNSLASIGNAVATAPSTLACVGNARGLFRGRLEQ